MLDDRFWTKVDKTHPEGCWIWTANRNNRGYGLFRPGGTSPKRLAHRLSYSEANGPIPDGALILHSCDNPACVNPSHLRAGSARANVADMDARGRRVSNPPRGADHYNTTATEDFVFSVRAAYLSGAPADEIVAAYGISRATFSDYVGGKSWAHALTDEMRAALKDEARRRRRNGAKITKDVADIIRTKLEAGATGVSLAKEFGLTPATISNIKLRQIWP